jgi:hypothetical protein
VSPVGGAWWLLAVTLLALIVGVGIAQNLKCKRCGIRRADCECGR